MDAVNIIIPSRLYAILKKHLFHGNAEQGAFMFTAESSRPGELNLKVDKIHLIPAEAWDVHSPYYLELSDQEKGKIMRMARELDRHPIECHSHRHSHGPAYFSASDIRGLDEFVEYVRWKLPGKKYGALVWTESSVYGQVWNDKKSAPLPVSRVRITRSWDGWSKVFFYRERPYNKIVESLRRLFKGTA